MQLTEQLLAVADAYCSVTGRSSSRVSTLIFNDGKKLDAMRSKGVDLYTGKFEAGMQWFSDNWPEGEDKRWPKAIARPAKSRAGAVP